MKISVLWLVCLIALPASASWRTLKDGLQYQELEDRGAHVFRLDLEKVRLDIGLPEGLAATAKRIAKGTEALVSVNGGFFDERLRSLGLLISGGKRINPLRRADWGVLSIKNHRARVVHTRDYKDELGTEFAIQVGPRLVVNGKPTKLRPQFGRRTALGIEAGGRHVLLVVSQRVMKTDAMAELMVELGSESALNLDGGSSTQLWSRFDGIPQVVGVPVANAVLVLLR